MWLQALWDAVPPNPVLQSAISFEIPATPPPHPPPHSSQVSAFVDMMAVQRAAIEVLRTMRTMHSVNRKALGDVPKIR